MSSQTGQAGWGQSTSLSPLGWAQATGGGRTCMKGGWEGIWGMGGGYSDYITPHHTEWEG